MIKGCGIFDQYSEYKEIFNVSKKCGKEKKPDGDLVSRVFTVE